MALIGLFALAAIAAALCLLEARRERHLPVEADEHDDGDWAWPARKVGPVGRTRIEDRRVA